MRDQALERAIGAAGGVRALARAVGVSQPAISSWKRVPADRVLSIEALTGIARSELRPDLYPHEPIVVETTAPAIDEIDAARADEFELVGALLWRAPTAGTLAALQGLRGDASPLGMAHLALAEAAAEATPEQVRDEFFQLFIGVGRGEAPALRLLLPHRFPARAPARSGTRGHGQARSRPGRARRRARGPCCRADGHPGQADPRRGLGEGVDEASFFARHIRPWADRFFADLETAEAARFYRAVGRVGSLYLSIETQAASLPA